MSPSLESANDDQHLIRYLLGQLSEEEAERLDEMSITDDDTAARLRVAEDDLVDAYVRGALPPETRARFEQVYLASARRRERVEFAQHFRRALDQPDVPVHTTPAPAAVPSTIARPPRPWLAWAAAILAITCGGLLVEQMRLRSGLDDARKENAALDAHAQTLARELSAAQTAMAGEVTSAAHPVIETPAAPANAADTPVHSMVLLPDTRAASAAPALVLAAVDQRPSFTLRLEPGDFSRYEVTLHDPATNRQVWKSGEIKVDRDSPAPSLQVTVPGAILKPQHYSFTVTGLSAAGRREVVGSYTFEVQR